MSSRKATEVIRLTPLTRQALDLYIAELKTVENKTRITPDAAVQRLLKAVAPASIHRALELRPDFERYDVDSEPHSAAGEE